MTPQEYVQQKVAASGSSFYYAFLFLPTEKRAAITAFYAFCREVDDIVDEMQDSSVAGTKLAWWHGEVDRLYAGKATHPVTQALSAWIQTFAIHVDQLHAVIAGCEMDLTQTRYLDRPALNRYCALVAGAVGEVSARIFGQSSPETTRYAHTLGLAFQWTNIIRDVGEDALRGRVYLPLTDLQAHEVKVQEILRREHSSRFVALMSALAEHNEHLYDEALALLPADDRRAQKPGLMMAKIYRTLLREIVASNFQVLHQRIALTPLRKLWLAWRVQALGSLP